ncbi:MAG: DUF4340 domain-containing protein [Bacteroidales bacterium]|nr:DUF4340 domain-containing protein [Bacteroidales bacterium]
MKKNKISLIIVFVLLIISAYFYFSNSKSTIKKELRDFAVEDTSIVTKIFMVNKESNQLLLERQNGYWTVNKEYKARKDLVDLLLKTINRLHVKAPVSNSALENINKSLAVKSIKVEIYQHDKLIKTYYVGGPTQDNYGTFMLIENSSKPFIVNIPGFRGFLSTRYNTSLSSWREKIIFNYKFQDISSISVTIPENPEKSFLINNLGNNKFELINTQNKNLVNKFDTIAVKQYIAYFKNINFDMFVKNVDSKNQDSILSTSPKYIISVIDINGESKKIKTYLKPNDGGLINDEGELYEYDVDNLYAFINNDKDMVFIQYFVFDPIFKEIDDFILN